MLREVSFPDHHPFRPADLSRLAGRAEALDAGLVTTEKDWVRLSPEWRDKVSYLPETLSFDKPQDLAALVERAVNDKRATGEG